jgi:hypothetical protein
VSIADAANWTSAIATVLAVVVALFKDELMWLWRHPKLVVEIHPGRLGCQKTDVMYRNPSTGEIKKGECYYFRLWVENKGNLRADRVQVYAFSLSRRQADGTFKAVEGFLPMNLCWTHLTLQNGRPEVYLDGLSPMMGWHCDIGRIMEPSVGVEFGESLNDVHTGQTIISLALEVSPLTKSNLLGLGVYRLTIKLAAANSKPVNKVLEITHKGQWYPNEEKMCAEGLGVRLV